MSYFMCLPLVELVRLADQSQGDNPLAEALARKLSDQDEALQHLIREIRERTTEKFNFFLADAQESLEEKLADPDLEDKNYLIQVFCNELKHEFPQILQRELRTDITEIIKAQGSPPK